MLKEGLPDHVIIRARVLRWQKQLSESLEEVVDDKHPGRPVTTRNIGKVQKIEYLCRKTDI